METLNEIKPDQKSQQTIAEYVVNDFRNAEIFNKFGLDFCCGGNKTLEKACKEKGINVSDVESAMNEIGKTNSGNELDFNHWELDFLADYIINVHHKYVSESIPFLEELSEKVARVHGENHPELVAISQLVFEITAELTSHMHKEEMILFPVVKKMAIEKRNGEFTVPAGLGSLSGPIRVMEAEHVSAGGNLEKIKKLSKNFVPPAEACNSYRVFYAKLQEFENDLHKHIHLENNILFPKALKMESEISNFSN